MNLVKLGILFPAVLTAVVLTGCPPEPVYPPGPDGGTEDTYWPPDPEDYADAPQTPCSRACSTLRRLGCPEGAPPENGGDSCTAVCQHVVDTKLTPIDPACIAAATTKAAARECGSTVKCR